MDNENILNATQEPKGRRRKWEAFEEEVLLGVLEDFVARKQRCDTGAFKQGRKASFFVVRSDAGVSSGSNSKARRADQLITNVVATKADGAAASTASKPGGEMMRGAGGPLLCIGDLLSDVGESDASPPPQQPETSSSSFVSSSDQSLDLTKLFQENYEQLNEALDGTDHSWAALTLKLCSALETANKLVQSTNSNVMSMSEKVGELEGVIKRADSAITAARVVHSSLNKKEGPLIGNQNAK